jgi:hypothetical protein
LINVDLFLKMTSWFNETIVNLLFGFWIYNQNNQKYYWPKIIRIRIRTLQITTWERYGYISEFGREKWQLQRVCISRWGSSVTTNKASTETRLAWLGGEISITMSRFHTRYLLSGPVQVFSLSWKPRLNELRRFCLVYVRMNVGIPDQSFVLTKEHTEHTRTYWHIGHDRVSPPPWVSERFKLI